MLIAVVGSSGLNRVEGITAEHPAALLQADAATSAGHVLLLAPWYAESIAKEQAHVLIAASPRTSVAVLTPRHHPLTLTLIGAAALQTAGTDADPGLVVALVNAAAARSRSLVWYPRVWGLREPTPTAGQLLASTFRSPGYFREIATEPALVRAKAGSPVAPTDEVYVAGNKPGPAAPAPRRGGRPADAHRGGAAPAVRHQVGDAADRAGGHRAPAGQRAGVPVLRRAAGGRRLSVLRSRRLVGAIGQVLESVEHG